MGREGIFRLAFIVSILYAGIFAAVWSSDKSYFDDGVIGLSCRLHFTWHAFVYIIILNQIVTQLL